MIEKKVKISILYDFYNQLLTERQKDIIDLYHNQDLSLGEIAEGLEITRQAVYDSIKRTEKILFDYEEKLRLIHNFNLKLHYIDQLKAKLKLLETEIKTISSEKNFEQEINDIKLLINELSNIESSR